MSAAWILVIAVSLVLNTFQVHRNTEESTRIQARVAYEKDVLFRRWNAGHGGVYVQISEETQPNPYLNDIEERNISTPLGKELTLINPAYMTRQVHELQLEQNGVLGHITSLNPIRLENAPDKWEINALEAFELGELEVSSIEVLDEKKYLRLMRPLITEQGCLLCHASQGYQVGDIRGGISVSVPMAPLMEIERGQIIALWGGHLSFLLLGFGAIFRSWRQSEAGERIRLRTEQTLFESEYRFRVIFEQAAVGVALIRSKTGEYIRVNQRFGDILGYSIDELQSKTYHEITHQDDLQTDNDNLEKFFRGDTRALNVTKRYLHKDGSIIWVNINGSTLWSENEEPDQHVTIIEDITERTLVESDLRESEAKLQSIFRVAPIGIGLVGETRQLLWVNDTLCEMVGYDQVELTGQSARFLYPSNEDYEYVGRAKYEQIAEKGAGTVETRWQRKDGSIIEVILSSTPIDLTDRSVGVTFTALDITDRIEAENQLQKRADQLELLRQASLRLTSNLALESVLASILDQAMELVTADDAHIFLYEGDVLHFGAVKYIDGRRDGQFAEPRQDGITYSVARSGVRLLIPDMSNHPLFEYWPLEGSIVGLPLKIGDQVVGVMNIAIDLPRDFAKEELRIMELLADQAAIAIENARLHEEVKDHAKNLEARVEDRTAELKKIIDLMAGREVRMAELKKVIKQLRKQLKDSGIPPIANDPLEEPFI
ncbi:MAG: PAS domain S-box protein [Anaerolineales bacterium]|nr:PAS domain S-box protein [Anaerolineales bacterium]